MGFFGVIPWLLPCIGNLLFGNVVLIEGLLQKQITRIVVVPKDFCNGLRIPDPAIHSWNTIILQVRSNAV